MKQKIFKASIVVGCLAFIFVFLAPFVSAASLGRSIYFYIDPEYDLYGREFLLASLRHISDKAYFFIDEKWWRELSSYKKIKVEKKLEILGEEFDNSIYPRLVQFFGEPWNPGIDGDERITILMSPLDSNAGGYFDSCNEYPREKCSSSNQREMIYVNINFIFDPKIRDFIAHEFQHLINWNVKKRIKNVEEEIWINEMKSEYVPTLLGYNEPFENSTLEMRIKDFLSDPTNPLGEWKGKSGDYGVITLLAHYLADHFGKNIFSLMNKSDFTGIKSINEALKLAGYNESFSTIFINWGLANYYNSLSMGSGGKYGYTTPELKKIRISPTVSNFGGYGSVVFAEKVKDWSPRWYLIRNKFNTKDDSTALKLEFKSAVTNSRFKVPYVINYKDGHHELGYIDLKNQSGFTHIFNFVKEVDSVLVMPVNQSKISNFTSNDPSVFFTLKASTVVINQPVITAITPSQGFSNGGEKVIIKGGNFKEGIEVYFGSAKASDVRVINDTTVEVVVPPHNVGYVNVWIKTPEGKTSILAQGFYYKEVNIPDGALIRAVGDYKVYIIKGNYKRHIIDGRIFDFYGHLDWSKIIEVDKSVVDSYRDSAWVRAVNDYKVYEINADKTKHWLNMTPEQFVFSGRSWDGVFIINDQERDFYKTGDYVVYR